MGAEPLGVPKSNVLFRVQTLLKIDWVGDDGIWLVAGDVLDVHSTPGGGDESWAAETSVVQDGEVVLVGRLNPSGEHDLSGVVERSQDDSDQKGEGWKTETELYHRICSHSQHCRDVRRHRSAW